VPLDTYRRFTQQPRLLEVLADYEAAVVEARAVLGEPVAHRLLVGWGQEMTHVAVRSSHSILSLSLSLSLFPFGNLFLLLCCLLFLVGFFG
jgi:hypothetical protein